MRYQRFLTPESKPFDPLELARETEKIVTREGREGIERKYTGFYSVPVYRGIATGYASGCCLRCIYCWANWSRDYPDKFGQFYSPRSIDRSEYVRNLSKFSRFIYVRVSFKAATPKGFTKRTGAIGRFYELPFKALDCLLDNGIYVRAAAMTDPKVMPEEERRILIGKLDAIDPSARYSETLEEEMIDAYDTTAKRLKAFTDMGFAEELEKEIREK